MYAICEGIHSRESREWWTGRKWSPASDEAKVYETKQDAELAANELDRPSLVVDIDAE